MAESLASQVGDITLDEEESEEGAIECYNLASYLGQSILRPDHKAALLEILRCAVCLEVPQHRKDLQIRCCKFGHHFCTACHAKLKTCAICRGNLESGRNFVVEEIIMKLGSDLGFTDSVCMAPSHPPAWPKGRFQCAHLCGKSFSASQMLPHIRDRHSYNLKDHLRTNPFTKWFQYNTMLRYSHGRKVLTFHVSEMGVLTLGIILPEVGSNNPILVWVQAINKANFKYLVLFTTGNKQFFGISDESVLDYTEAFDKDNYAKINTSYEFKLSEELEFSLIVHTPSATQPDRIMKSVMWKTPGIFLNDRRSRRTITRNKRRTNLRARYRELFADKPSTSSVIEF